MMYCGRRQGYLNFSEIGAQSTADQAKSRERRSGRRDTFQKRGGIYEVCSFIRLFNVLCSVP